jgi:heme A synthase
LAALVAAIGQVTLGGVVRVTESGLGCPDWPLCHGQVIPPLEYHALIEYSHRLSASALGLLTIVCVYLGWRSHRGDPIILASATAALALVAVAAVLGGITVRTELAWWVVLIHLGVAQLVIASLAVALLAGWNVGGHHGAGQPLMTAPSSHQLVLALAIAGTFGLILLGSYMVGAGYGSSCATWPLCRGTVVPEGTASLVHMAHRYVAALVGVMAAVGLSMAWRRRSLHVALGWAAAIAAGLYVAQLLVGAATVWTEFSTALKSAHLSVATLVWVSLVFVAGLSLAPERFGWSGRPG